MNWHNIYLRWKNGSVRRRTFRFHTLRPGKIQSRPLLQQVLIYIYTIYMYIYQPYECTYLYGYIYMYYMHIYIKLKQPSYLYIVYEQKWLLLAATAAVRIRLYAYTLVQVCSHFRNEARTTNKTMEPRRRRWPGSPRKSIYIHAYIYRSRCRTYILYYGFTYTAI